MWETSDCCGSLTDARAYDGESNPNTEFFAWGICPSYASKGNAGPNKTWCMPQIIYYNDGAYPGRYNDTPHRKALFCHELGHTMGLRHKTSSSSTSCMVTDPETRIHLTAHDEDMLSSNYPLP